MATAMPTTDEFHTKVNDMELEIFSLIWLNANTKITDNRDTEQKLRSIINRLTKFQNVNECQKFIEEKSQHERVVMIVSGRLGREIVPSIHKLRQVISIYVYCMDKEGNKQWACKFGKVKAVIVELEDLICRITADHKIQKKVEEPLSINIFSTNADAGKSTTGLNGQFVFYQVLIDCLLRLKYTKADKKELIQLCKQQYEDNSVELSNIHEFEQDWSSSNALWWYTRESFFYKILNAVLRKQDIHFIFLFRSYILDIHHQLKKHQSVNSLKVYRSQMISSDELKTFQQTHGQFISINSFFSTSTNKQKALSFLNVPTGIENLEPVLFEIDANPKMATAKSFADISSYSEYKDESEVLFMLGSIFRLNSVNHSKDNPVWIIQMTLCSDDEHDLKQVLADMKQQLGSGETNLQILGKILSDMGKFYLAEKYLTGFLEQLPQNYPLLGSLYEDLAKVASQAGDYNKSVQWHKKAVEFKKSNQPTASSNTNRAMSSTGKFIERKSITAKQLSHMKQNIL
ncbi:unnamed protein product [Rotaria sp. Silwood2]|nr:unnamed protein product [Rotaria sp. Silwood2]CAF3136451.1 unnamed protein product [Rotaria sp. Silwood2]